nr:hypothetical protein [Synergistaceae bacterium]
FLQIFERFLEATQKEVYDCTEGGALIRGTIICPFREYIHAHLSEPAEEPLVLSSSDFPAPSEEEMREHKEKVLSLLGRNMEYITSCHGILDKMENLVAAACAPGLSPQRRQQSAYEVAGLLDDLHAANPVLSFIGQSYTHLAGAVMAETRMLDSVPSIERWEKLHREIIASHRANVRFLEQWLTYAVDLLISSEVFPVAEGELPEESRITEMFGHLDTLPEGEERRKFVTELSDLLCRADPLEQEVSPEYLWSLGRFMISLGRAEDACRYMEKAYALWEGKERSSALIASFFREWGIMAGTHDLCRQPEYQKALELLRTAQTYAPEDKSLEELLREFYQRYFDHLQNVRTLAIKGTSGDLEIQIWALRSRAEEALLRKDLPEAMKTVCQIIEIAQDSFLAPPYVSWLGNTAFQCLQAADPVVKAASEEALAWLAENASRFVGEGVLFSSDLVAYLQKKGLKLGAETSDTGKKNEDITENRG